MAADAATEHALFLPGALAGSERGDFLAELLAKDNGFTRLYLGSEFCEHARPERDALDAILRDCERSNRAFSLVTPICTPLGIGPWASIIDTLPPGSEVVVNDLGLLPSVRDAACVPVHGRALNRVSRDPRVYLGMLSAELQRHFQSSIIHSETYQAWMRREGFARVELDHVPQGYRPLPKGCLPGSHYLPFSFVSAMRVCQGEVATCCPGTPCPTIQTRVIESPLLLMGTASYAPGRLPSSLGPLGFNRLVHQIPPGALEERRGPAAPIPWDAVYTERAAAARGEAFTDGFEDGLVRALPDTLGSILEIGCGFGEHLALAQGAGRQLVGIDLSEDAVQTASQRVPDASLRSGDFLDLDLDTRFDAILDLGCLHAVPPRRRDAYLAKVKAQLAPDGLYVLSAFERDPRLLAREPVYYVAGRVPEWGFRLDELQEALAPELELVWSAKNTTGNETPPRLVCVFSQAGASQALEPVFQGKLDGLVEACHEPPAAPAPSPEEATPEPPEHPWTAMVSGPLEALGITVERIEDLSDSGTFLRLATPKASFRVELRPAPSGQRYYKRLGTWEASYGKGLPKDLDLDVLFSALVEALPPEQN